MAANQETKQVVLITGGTSGIGLSLAEAFLGQGAAVAVCGRSVTALESFSRAHPDALAVQADVTIAEARAALLDAVAARFGRLDVLINNAGTFVERDFVSDIDATHGLEYEVALNLTAPIELTGAVLNRWPALAAIVFVTSGFALVSPTRAPTYGAVKAGLHGFAEGLRRQLEPTKTHVLELLPPTTDTPMNADLVGKKMSPAAVAAVTLKALARRRPMALPGSTKMLPTMLRITPNTITRAVAKM
ncbi:SDR family NAD(P)-dependent oxidoreductase [Mycobacterium sp. RTGN5]|uniref:SDR family NAD(P)-dependent oxidoreductase n=1 Tax=Mycobacterium sp. RTGN5 TaxID=3016522 RepID=UPI0029C8AFC0|nr:SDR family NAD(P)-dependent oxidoreductase [Mycobacterium sp. RTGN5]